jgi:hypothetical protein
VDRKAFVPGRTQYLDIGMEEVERETKRSSNRIFYRKNEFKIKKFFRRLITLTI